MKTEVRLSPSEKEVLGLIPKSGARVSTEWLAKRRYGADVPENGRVIISAIVRSLARKTKNAAVRVRRTDRAGPNPIKVWVERKPCSTQH
jgi:hypothetical protein